MFSHLGSGGDPEYQSILDLVPTAQWSVFQSKPGFSIEYGPDLILRRKSSDSKPASLSAQLAQLFPRKRLMEER